MKKVKRFVFSINLMKEKMLYYTIFTIIGLILMLVGPVVEKQISGMGWATWAMGIAVLWIGFSRIRRL